MVGKSLLGSLLPRLLRSVWADATKVERAMVERELIIVFADLSGFTALAERLSNDPRGVEHLHHVLNQHFDRVIDLVEQWGGSVFHFAGDATIAIWEFDPESAADAAARAMRCAQQIQSATDGVEIEPGISLRQRIVVAAGDAELATVGGLDGKWEFLAGGPVWDAVAATDSTTVAGEVAACPRVEALLAAVDADPAVPSPIDLAFDDDTLARGFLPNRVLAHVDIGDPLWLADFRRATIVFISIRGADSLEQLDAATRAVQHIRTAHDGAVVQYLYDDKGLVVIGAWGLAMSTHENNAARAVAAAHDVRDRLAAAGCSGSVGVSTGRVFAGLLGNDTRREYAVIGDAMNLAARLMGRADNDIVADDATLAELGDRFAYEALGTQSVKGKKKPVDIVRLARERESIGRRSADRSTLVGRDAELEEVMATLEDCAVVISAEAGTGKSRLADAVVAEAVGRGTRVVRGYGDPLHRSEPYFPWRPIVKKLVTDEHTRDERAPLLSSLIAVDLPESDFTRSLTPAGRDDALLGLLIDVIDTASEQTLLVLDDLHWFDTNSWRLLNLVRRRISILGLTRPLAQYRIPDEATRLIEAESTHMLHLGPFDASQSQELVGVLVKADRVAPPLAEAVFSRAEGNPLFTEQLVLSLLEQDLVAFGDGAATLRATGRSTSKDVLPDGVQGAVGSRIDQLAPAAQLTLKVASVIGRRFDAEAVAAVHPVASDADQLQRDIELMVDAQLIDANTTGFRFRHALIQDTAYDLLVGTQREQLHTSAARWYEAAGGLPNRSLLAHHWGRTSNDVAAISAYEAAAGWAASNNANHDVVHFIGLARERSTKVGGVEERRRAEWDAMAGHASANIGAFGDAITNLEAALSTLHRPQPPSTAKLAGAILGQFGRQVVHRLRPPGPADDAPALLAAAGCYGRLALIHYNNHDLGRSLLVNLAGINLADSIPHRHVRAQFSMNMAVTAQAIGWTKQAQYYRDQAFEAAEQVDDEDLLATSLPAMSMFEMGEGRVDNSIELMERQRSVVLRTGDPRMLEYVYAGIANSTRLAADYDASLHASNELLRFAFDRDVTQTQVWGYYGRAMCHRFVGDRDALADTLAPFGALLAQPAIRANISASNIISHGAGRSMLAADDGDIDAGFRHATEVAKEIATLRSIPAYVATCAGTLHDAVNALQHHRPGDARLEGLWAASDKFTKASARSFAVLRPQLRLSEGDRLARGGDTAAAQQKWREGAETANQMGLTFELAGACHRMGDVEQRDALLRRSGIEWPVGWVR